MLKQLHMQMNPLETRYLKQLKALLAALTPVISRGWKSLLELEESHAAVEETSTRIFISPTLSYFAGFTA